MNVTFAPATYERLSLDEERALYGITHATVKNCLFDGPADGESALKEASDVTVENCDFRLRYPLWHVHGGRMAGCTLTDTCRAALWYTEDMAIEGSTLGGIKALRECAGVEIRDCSIDSQEFGWKSKNITLTDCDLTAEYVFFDSRDVKLDRVKMKGKYYKLIQIQTMSDQIRKTKEEERFD